METKRSEVNPVRRLVCGVQEMLEPEAVTTIVRLGQSGWGAKRIARTLGIARNTVRRYLNAGGPVPFALWGCGVASNGLSQYDEASAAAGGLVVNPGHLLVPGMLGPGRLDAHTFKKP